MGKRTLIVAAIALLIAWLRYFSFQSDEKPLKPSPYIYGKQQTSLWTPSPIFRHSSVIRVSTSDSGQIQTSSFSGQDSRSFFIRNTDSIAVSAKLDKVSVGPIEGYAAPVTLPEFTSTLYRMKLPSLTALPPDAYSPGIPTVCCAVGTTFTIPPVQTVSAPEPSSWSLMFIAGGFLLVVLAIKSL